MDNIISKYSIDLFFDSYTNELLKTIPMWINNNVDVIKSKYSKILTNFMENFKNEISNSNLNLNNQNNQFKIDIDVFKKQQNELKKQQNELKKQYDKLKIQHDKLKIQHDKLKKQYNILKLKISHIKLNIVNTISTMKLNLQKMDINLTNSKHFLLLKSILIPNETGSYLYINKIQYPINYNDFLNTNNNKIKYLIKNSSLLYWELLFYLYTISEQLSNSPNRKLRNLNNINIELINTDNTNVNRGYKSSKFKQIYNYVNL
jgi:hypothetical protein